MSDQLLHDFAVAAAAADGDAVAVAMGDERMTYAELTTLSGRLAARLVDAGVKPGDRIGLLIPKRPLAIVAMHAALEAGAAYVPLDLESPAARLARILTSAAPTLILSVPEAAPRLDDLAEQIELPPVWSVEPGPVAGERFAGELARGDWDVAADPPGVRVQPDELAQILFTSGSTGEPKGVMTTHRNIVAAVEWGVRELGTVSDDRVSCHAPLHFDQSTADVYATLAAGAEVHLVPPGTGLDPHGIARLIRESELTQWCSVPSVLSYMAKFDAVGQDDFPALRRLLWGGEALPAPVLAQWMELLPHVQFTNLYGPTETTITSCFHTVSAPPNGDGRPVPIGRPCDGEELFVVDSGLRPLPAGETGEICIAGIGLARGYWGDEEKTARAFIPDPRGGERDARAYRTGDLGWIDEHGDLHFAGRADTQIKSRGYRIELAEIESALAALDGIDECAVVGVELGGFEGTAICAAYAAGEERQPAELRTALAQALPSYMLPARWLALASLPTTPNGKIDRVELRGQFELQLKRGRERRATR